MGVCFPGGSTWAPMGEMNPVHTSHPPFLRPPSPGPDPRVRTGERRTQGVVALTVVMMVAELVMGSWSGSMALMADGWAMGSHAVVLGIPSLAAVWGRGGTWPKAPGIPGKVGALAGYTCGVVLILAACFLVWESVERLSHPVEVHHAEALLVAALGLLVNLVSAAILRAGRKRAGGSSHRALRHVMADALTSVAAIMALASGRWLGWRWPDLLVGLGGGLLIAGWAWRLAREAGSRLLGDDVPPASL